MTKIFSKKFFFLINSRVWQHCDTIKHRENCYNILWDSSYCCYHDYEHLYGKHFCRHNKDSSRYFLFQGSETKDLPPFNESILFPVDSGKCGLQFIRLSLAPRVSVPRIWKQLYECDLLHLHHSFDCRVRGQLLQPRDHVFKRQTEHKARAIFIFPRYFDQWDGFGRFCAN